MRRTLTLILGVALVGILAAVAVASQGADDPAGFGTTTAEKTNDRTTTVEDNPAHVGDDDGQPGVDISGPCDEAEHANDPRCAGQATAGQAPAPGVDISGPCDEAEHVNDPRCTGAAVDDDDGRHGGDDDGVDDNSGPGSASSGPGPGGDDDSGRGRGRGRGGDSD